MNTEGKSVKKDKDTQQDNAAEAEVSEEATQQDEPVVEAEVEMDAELTEEDALPVEEQLEQLQAQADEYLDGWQRARAEFANYKKRVEKEREETRARIAGELITGYLGVLDDLERALAEPPNGDEVSEWITGIDLIYQKFQSLLESEGVEAIEPEGDPFDPNFHEAVTFEDSDDHKAGYIIETTQRGYQLNDRVLRPAMVRVAK
jgi:molecular chaperone GrpE